MNPGWTITNCNSSNQLSKIDVVVNELECYSNVPFEKYGALSLYIEGHVIPREGCNQKFKSLSQYELVSKLFSANGDDFIQKVKGNFVILLLKDTELNVFTDRIGIKKVFYWHKKDRFIISNELELLKKNLAFTPVVSTTNIALHSLFHHFIDGRTIYKDIYYSKPASHFIITSEENLIIEEHWNYEELLKLPPTNRTFEEFSNLFKKLTKDYLKLTNEKVTMTLTGGMDSRIVLGSLLENKHQPYTFTFGNKYSADVDTSSKITEALGLEYHIHDFPNPDAKWYFTLSGEIADLGQGMIHIHRSHRLDAIKREKKLHPETNTIFLGSMGGEGIRGLHYDDLITTSFVRRIYESNESIDDLMEEYLQKYFHDSSLIDLGELKQIIKNQDFIKNDYKTNQFFLLYQLVASLHDTQDIHLYYQYYDYVICPFLDIDYLEMLFSSQYHLLNKNATSHKIKDRLIIPEFHVNVSHLINQELSSFQYSNGFSPKEYLLGKYSYLLIRGFRKYFKPKYPPNFPYDDWFIKFVSENLENVNSELLGNIFEINKMKQTLNGDHGTVEGYWHKYSNIIMYDMILSNAKTKL